MISPKALKKFDKEINIPLQTFLIEQLKDNPMAKIKENPVAKILDEELITKELAPLDKTKSASVRKAFEPMVKMLEKMEIEAEEIYSLDLNKETCGKARGLRLRIQKVRIDADKARKEEKAQYILGGNAIQGFYNIFKAAITPVETRLEEIEKHFENLAKKKIEDLQAKRTLLLEKIGLDGSIMKLGEMDEDVWDNYFSGVSLKFKNEEKARKEATAAEKLKEERNAILEKRKILLMPYGQFNPFLDLYPETTEEEFQEILNTMKKAKADFDKTQADLLLKQEEIKKENEKLKEIVSANVPKELTKEEFKKKTLSGLLGKNSHTPVPIKYQDNELIDEPEKTSINPSESCSSDKEVLAGVSKSIKARVDIVTSKEAKDALNLAANTLDIAAMML